MFDQKKRELEFYLTSNCDVEFTEVKNLGENYSVITINNAESLSIIAYEIWSTDTLLINNKSRSIYQKNLIEFYNIVKSYNEKTNNMKDHFKPSCVFKYKDSQNINKVYYVTIEKFELVENVNNGSGSNDSGLIVDNANTNSLKMYCKNNFVDTDGDDLFTTNERIPNGNYENVNFNMSGFTFNDLDIESQFNPKTTNRYSMSIDKNSNIFSHNPVSKNVTSKPGYNYILDSECIINNEDPTFLYITITDTTDMITEYQDWNQSASRVSNQEFRNKHDITMSEFVSRVNEFNSFLTIKPGSLSRKTLKLKKLWFKPTVYFEIQEKKYLGVITDFELKLDNNNEYFLNITIEKSKMRLNENAAFDYSTIKSTPYTNENDTLITSEQIFMNIDDLPDANSFDPVARNNMLYVYGLTILAKKYDTRDALSRLGLLGDINSKLENEVFLGGNNTTTYEPIQSNPNNSFIDINANHLLSNDYTFSGNTGHSHMRASFIKGFVNAIPAHKFRISTQVSNYVPNFINIFIPEEENYDTIITIHNTTLRKLDTFYNFAQDFELNGSAIYHIEVCKMLKNSKIKYEKGKAKDFANANSGAYTMTIQARIRGPTFFPIENMGVNRLNIENNDSDQSGQNYNGDNIVLNNRGGFIKGTTGNPTYITELSLTETTTLNVQFTEKFDAAYITIVPISEDRIGFRDEAHWYRFSSTMGIRNLTLDGPSIKSKYSTKRYQIEFSSINPSPSPYDNPDFQQKFGFILNVGGTSFDPTQPQPGNILMRASSNLKLKNLNKIDFNQMKSKSHKKRLIKRNNGIKTRPVMRETMIRVLVENNDLGESTLIFENTLGEKQNYINLNRGTFYKFDISRLPPNKSFEIRTDPADTTTTLEIHLQGSSGASGSYISFIPQMNLPVDRAYFVENYIPGLSEGDELRYGILNFPFPESLEDAIFNYTLKVVENRLKIFTSNNSELNERLNVYQGYEYRFDISDTSLAGRTVNFSSENRFVNNILTDRNGSAGNPNSYINITFEVSNIRNGGGEDYKIYLTGSGGEEIIPVIIHTMDPYNVSEEGMTPLVYLSLLALLSILAFATRARRVTEIAEGQLPEGQRAEVINEVGRVVTEITGQNTPFGRNGVTIQNPSFDGETTLDSGVFVEPSTGALENAQALAQAINAKVNLTDGLGAGGATNQAQVNTKSVAELEGKIVKVFNDIKDLEQYGRDSGDTNLDPEVVNFDDFPHVVHDGQPDDLIIKLLNKNNQSFTGGTHRAEAGDGPLEFKIEPRGEVPITATRNGFIKAKFEDPMGNVINDLFFNGVHLYNITPEVTSKTGMLRDDAYFDGYCLSVPPAPGGDETITGSGLRELPTGEIVLLSSEHSVIGGLGVEGGGPIPRRVDTLSLEAQTRPGSDVLDVGEILYAALQDTDAAIERARTDPTTGGGAADNAAITPGDADIIYTAVVHASEEAGVDAGRIDPLEGDTIYFTEGQTMEILDPTTRDDLISDIITDLEIRLEPFVLSDGGSTGVSSREALEGALRIKFNNDIKPQLEAIPDLTSTDVFFYTSKLFEDINLADYFSIDGEQIMAEFFQGQGPPELQRWRNAALADGGAGLNADGSKQPEGSINDSTDVFNEAKLRKDGTMADDGIDLRSDPILERVVINYQINKLIVADGLADFNGDDIFDHINNGITYKSTTSQDVRDQYTVFKDNAYNSSLNEITGNKDGNRWKFLSNDADYIESLPLRSVYDLSPTLQNEITSFQTSTGNQTRLTEQNQNLADIVNRNVLNTVVDGVRIERGIDKVLATVGTYRVPGQDGGLTREKIPAKSELDVIFDDLFDELNFKDASNIDPERPYFESDLFSEPTNATLLDEAKELLRRAQENAIADLTADKVSEMLLESARLGRNEPIETAVVRLYSRAVVTNYNREIINLRGPTTGFPPEPGPPPEDGTLLSLLTPAKAEQIDAFNKFKAIYGDRAANLLLNRVDPNVTIDDIINLFPDGEIFSELLSTEEQAILDSFTEYNIDIENGIINDFKDTDIFTKLDTAVTKLYSTRAFDFQMEIAQTGWEILNDPANPEAQQKLNELRDKFQGVGYNEFGADEAILDALYKSAQASLLNVTAQQIRDIETTVNRETFEAGEAGDIAFENEVNRRLIEEVKVNMRTSFPDMIAETPPPKAGSILSDEFKLEIKNDGKILFEKVEPKIDPFLEALMDFKPI